MLLPSAQYWVQSWSNDGRFLAVGDFNASTADILILRDDGELRPYLATRSHEYAASSSPNDRFVAYVSEESGQKEVYVRAFPEPAGLVKVSTNGGTAPVWSRDGTELFYRQGRGLMSVSVSIDGEFRAGTPELVLSGNFHADASGHAGYDVMPDGQSFVMIQEDEDAALTEIHVVLNWHEELERLVPTEN